MMVAIEARAQAIAAQAQQQAIATLAERAEAALPGVSAEAQDDGVVLSGPGLAQRLVSDATLRWIGSLMR